MQDVAHYSRPVSEMPQKNEHLDHVQKIPECFEWDCNDQRQAQITDQKSWGRLKYHLVSLVHKHIVCIIWIILSGQLEFDLSALIYILWTVNSTEEVLILDFSY